MERKKNSVTIVGRKDRTDPTPTHTPSISRECTAALIPRFASAWSSRPVSPSIPSESQSESTAPMTLNVRKNVSSITHRKIGMPKYLCVSTRSIWMERCSSRAFPFFLTASLQALAMKS